MASDPLLSWPHFFPRCNKWTLLPCLGTQSHSLKYVPRPFVFQPAYYCSTTLRQLLASVKDAISKDERSGKCKDCPVYLGETSRQLKVRITEHLSASSSGSLGESASADHFIIHCHSSDRDSATCGMIHQKGADIMFGIAADHGVFRVLVHALFSFLGSTLFSQFLCNVENLSL